MTESIPHVQRCTITRAYGEGRNLRTWQCLRPDPHPGVACDFGIDAEVFGRDLDTQPVWWLAASLRDRVAMQRNVQRRLEELQAIAMDLADIHAGGGMPNDATAAWLLRNAPVQAALLGIRP